MKRYIICLLAAASTTASVPSARSDELVREFLGKIVGTIGDEVSKEISSGFDRRRNQPVEQPTVQSAPGATGYCQVWRGGSLTVQMQCNSVVNCGNDGTCLYQYVWPSGGETTVAVQGGMPKSLNGKPTSLIEIGRDLCVVDAPSDIFCYTVQPQSPYAAAFITENPPPVAIQQETAAAVPDFETVLQGYLATTENQDPSARTQRCRLGITLVREHSGSLDSELQGLILQQLERDECSG